MRNHYARALRNRAYQQRIKPGRRALLGREPFIDDEEAASGALEPTGENDLAKSSTKTAKPKGNSKGAKGAKSGGKGKKSC